MKSRNRELTSRILRVIQRVCDVQGNVTMIRLAENIAAEIGELDTVTTDAGCAACGAPRWHDSALCEECHRDSGMPHPGGVA